MFKLQQVLALGWRKLHIKIKSNQQILRQHYGWGFNFLQSQPTQNIGYPQMAEHGRSREDEAEIRDIVKLSKLRSQHCAATALGEGFAQSREGLGLALRHAGSAVSPDLTPPSR